ncbi:hypothetical protein SDC9_172304 [bioreactor metagenome]|uniref:Uncharacterized protein n=1 Tax=bioreactor metagenome TaxID=1076179 RepID=A0A645GGI6_9ZZZZ
MAGKEQPIIKLIEQPGKKIPLSDTPVRPPVKKK